jgi:hypothetical protein
VVDLGVRQHEESPQERGRASGVQADLGEDAPVLQIGEAVLVRRLFAADQPVRLLLRVRERMAVGRPSAGDDDWVVRVVQPDEAESGQSTQTGLTQAGSDPVVTGDGDLAGVSRLAAEIQTRLPASSVRARNSRPRALWLPE